MKTLRELIQNLNLPSKTALEHAVSDAVKEKHHVVSFAHWIKRLLEDPTIMQLILSEQVNMTFLHKALGDYLAHLPKLEAAVPVFEENFTLILNTACDYAATASEPLNTGYLLMAMLTESEKMPVFLQNAVSHLDPIALQVKIREVQPGSVEVPETNQTLVGRSDSTQKMLNVYTQNLTEKAKKGQLDLVFGRQKEVQQMIDILLRRRQNNPILLGEAGVGKTALVEGLALKIAKAEVPEELQNVELHLLDLTLLQAGASVKGEFEERLKKLLAEIQTSVQPIILFIDEIHTLVGAGGPAGQQDAANILKPALARGELRTIGATTVSEYKKYFEKDSALVRRFQSVWVDEPTFAEAKNILYTLLPAFEKHHGVYIDSSAIHAAVELSARYLPTKQLPDKAITLLDTACARVRLSRNKPASLSLVEEELALINMRLNREEGQEQAIDLKKRKIELIKEANTLKDIWEKSLSLLTEVEQLHKELADHKTKKGKQYQALKAKVNAKEVVLAAFKAKHALIHDQVDREVVAEVLTQITGIPLKTMLEEELSSVLSLNDRLQAVINGQDFALNKLGNAIKVSKSGLADPNKPLGVFMLVGPSGVGKTETALNIAKILFGNEEALTVINMSEFKEAHRVSLLTGSPPGYVGYGEGGILTEAVRHRPYSVLLLDEVDKAHESVMDVFYQVFDKGMLVDGEGRLVNFRNVLIIMTANLGIETITQAAKGVSDMKTFNVLTAKLEEELVEHFKPALLSRFKIIPYLPLNEMALSEIVKQKVKKIEDRVKNEYDVDLIVSSKLISSLAQSSKASISGARFIDKWLSEILLTKLAETILIQKKNKNLSRKLYVNQDKFGVRIKVSG